MKKCWQIRDETESEVAEMLLYGEISDETWQGDEVTPRQLAADLQNLGGKNLVVRVNSPGGDVFAAQAIYNQIKAYKGHVTMQIDGLAASAATIVTCAGDEVIMPTNALFMIHNPKSAFLGFYDAGELLAEAKVLETVRQTIVNVYLARAKGLTETQLKHKMDAETWLTADEALAYGFIDRIAGEKVKNSIKGDRLIVNSVSCGLDAFRNARGLREAYAKISMKNAAIAAEKGGIFVKDSEILAKIKNLLGLSKEPEQEPKAEAKTELDPVQQERERMMALDALDNHKGGAVSRMIAAAKEGGMDAEAVKPYLDIVRESEEKADAQAQTTDAIKALIRDNLTSGAEGVAAAAPAQDEGAKKKAAIDEVVNLANAGKE